MRFYETVFIMQPDFTESKVKEIIERFKEGLIAQGGQVTQIEEWGMRELAYPLKKQGKGIYVVFQYRLEPSRVREFERQLKLSEDVMRYISVRKVTETGQITGGYEATQES
jgi:small subunit ribosomal protein S6